MLAVSRLIRHRGPLLLLPGSLVLLISGAVTSQAQMGNNGIDDDRASGMRQGMNTIVGQVIFPTRQEPSRRCTVRLSSVRVGEFSTMTDTNGVFTFRRLREGSYFITVEAGKDYQPAQETVDFYDNRGRTATVQMELRLRPNPVAKRGVLNASLAGIPKKAIELYDKGVAAAAAGDNKKAIEQLRAAIAIHPAFVLALNELSAAYVNENDLASAEQVLAEALKYEPNNATLHLNLGYVLLLRAKIEDAERQLQRAIQLNPKSINARLHHGRALILLKRFADAEAELKQALVLGGDASAVAYRYLGALYREQGDAAKAIAALEEYLKLRPNAKDADEIQKTIKELKEQKP